MSQEKQVLPNNQVQAKKQWGGPRKNSGRKHGQKQKLSALQLLREIEKKDKPFAVGLAEDYHNARMGGDKHLVMKYQQMIINKVVADKVDIDHTTLGESLNTNFSFPRKETSDWSHLPVTIKVKDDKTS